VLATLACDILSIPASGAGVERLFNCARDICHYRRGKLKPDTIKQLMLHMCASKFEIKQREIDYTKELISAGEAAIIDQERGSIPALPLLDPISDDEEDELVNEPLSEQPAIHNEQARYKRPRSRSPHSQDDEDDDQYLQEAPFGEGSTQRTGRIRKKPKMPEGFEIYAL
jgi:hypothetical protein